MSPDDKRHGTTTGYRYGCRESCCRRAVARQRANERKRRYLERTDTFTVSAIGTHRRIQALAALGWSNSEVSRRAGYDRSHLGLVLRRPLLWRTTAERISAIYDELSMRLPPEQTHGEKIAAARARKQAVRNGWAPPLAWTDIDDPDERPTIGVETKARNGGRSVANLLEDAEWLADGDATLTEVVERLSVNRDTFRETCTRAGRSDLYWRLARREPDGEQRWETSQGIKRSRGAV